MPEDLPYLPAVGNIPAILDKIRTAGTPPKFTLEFLSKTLGFTASQDRGMPKIFKKLGFLTADGTPTQRYNDFKSTSTGGRALAVGLREGWSPIFLADQQAYNKTAGELTDIFKSVTGEGEAKAKKMASTFKALAGKAEWTDAKPADEGGGGGSGGGEEVLNDSDKRDQRGGLSLHSDVHIHLPPTSDVSVYRAIFQALREELM
ncbi:DUF5343 domain-containing protein [Cellulomonas humilata]|uniref:DUF5343 domain-containing protein n=1 Tax=Cellulomonas humilata TaxID=144055 RepID=A0A7Y6A0C6_9CELL|nr:DUF5343 domain-containing protein [Cellulomonas humilata]NUU16114.1 DUF5343 domain-containing protein [Cellulomonas humilata]